MAQVSLGTPTRTPKRNNRNVKNGGVNKRIGIIIRKICIYRRIMSVKFLGNNRGTAVRNLETASRGGFNSLSSSLLDNLLDGNNFIIILGKFNQFVNLDSNAPQNVHSGVAGDDIGDETDDIVLL